MWLLKITLNSLLWFPLLEFVSRRRCRINSIVVVGDATTNKVNCSWTTRAHARKLCAKNIGLKSNHTLSHGHRCWTSFEVMVEDIDYHEISVNGENTGVQIVHLEVGVAPSCSCRLVLRSRLVLDFGITKRCMTYRLLEPIDPLKTQWWRHIMQTSKSCCCTQNELSYRQHEKDRFFQDHPRLAPFCKST
jgi:hypothetical protein